MVSKNSGESKEAAAKLITELTELTLVSLELETAIRMLKSAETQELIDLLLKPLDVNAILPNLNKN